MAFTRLDQIRLFFCLPSYSRSWGPLANLMNLESYFPKKVIMESFSIWHTPRELNAGTAVPNFAVLYANSHLSRDTPFNPLILSRRAASRTYIKLFLSEDSSSPLNHCWRQLPHLVKLLIIYSYLSYTRNSQRGFLSFEPFIACPRCFCPH